jgi:chromodomain-helicase-DNA-binding protein 7
MGMDLDKLLRVCSHQILNGVDGEEEDIDQILSRPPVIDEVDIDLEDPDFWQNLLEDHDEESRVMTTENVPLPDSSGEDESHPSTSRWDQSALWKLRRLLFIYGWGRWDRAGYLCGLNLPVTEVKLAGRAVLRWLISATKDLRYLSFAVSLLDSAYSPEFDPAFETREISEAVDAEFMNQAITVDPEFALIKKRSTFWLRRLELVALVTMAVERANCNMSEIVVPKLDGALPADWWTENDDRCLIYGTWNWGFERYSQFKADPKISFTDDSLPREMALTARLQSLVGGIRKLYSLASNQDEIASKVLHQLLHGGVPLGRDGSLDWAKFREICDLTNSKDEEIELVANVIIESGPDQYFNIDENDDREDSDDGGRRDGQITVTGDQIKQQFVELTRLRRAFLKHKEEMKDYFLSFPGWRKMPQAWTNEKEFVFFKEISRRGFGVYEEILEMPEFDGVFDDELPISLTQDSLVLKRLTYILDFMELNPLQKPSKESRKSKNKGEDGQPAMPIPKIAYDDNGAPVLPIHVTYEQEVLDLGHIVTDRRCFHSAYYIFPAGFKSRRLFASILNPSEKVWYISEIIDTGGDLPLFRVTMESHPEISFESHYASIPWTAVGKKVLEMRGQGDRQLNVSGPPYFGLAHPVVCYLLQQMEGADKCVNYVMRPFEKPKPKKSEDAPVQLPEIADSPVLPISFGPDAYVINLGHIVTDRAGFHSAKYIYPAGFKSSRFYASTLNPSDRVRYTSEILDTGLAWPLFRVTMDDHPEIVFEGKSPSGPWNAIAKIVGASRVGGSRATVPGPDFFGLVSPVVRSHLQRLDGVDKLQTYVMQ